MVEILRGERRGPLFGVLVGVSPQREQVSWRSVPPLAKDLYGGVDPYSDTSSTAGNTQRAESPKRIHQKGFPITYSIVGTNRKA
jgi:hypothetical protein